MSKFFLAVILAVLCAVSAARADTRVALVIGNGKYQNVPYLPNPTNDAADISEAFKRLGFTVRTLTDANFDEMRRTMREFSRQAREADMAVVFFAGHGMEVGGENWLIPVDAELRTDVDAENEAISLRSVSLQVAGARQLGLVILDACRNNPFAAKMNRAQRVRAVERGFARVEPTDNVLIAYAAKDGTTANDGAGRNSPFTAALLKNIEMPGLEIQFMFRNVRDDVMASTRREQQPFVYGSLSRESIYLKAVSAKQNDAAPASPLSGDPAAQAWSATQSTTSAAVLNEFIRRYGDSFYAALARARLEELKERQQAALVVPPPAAAAPPDGCNGNAVAASSKARLPCPLSGPEERSLRARDVFKECDKCPEMVVVPAGQFMMGSPTDENGRSHDEGPQHRVTIERPFAVGKFHVTVEQFKSFSAESGYGINSSCEDKGGGTNPKVCLIWDDARAYVAWLASKTGKPYRLLSEAEWEYSARGESSTRYFFGEDASDLCRYANGKDQSAGRANSFRWTSYLKCDDRYVYTSPVGTYTANGFGLYDVVGNAWQWLEDCWNNSYVGAPVDGSAWTSGDCSNRVVRGGSYDDGPAAFRSAFRFNKTAVWRYSTVGFRVARALAP